MAKILDELRDDHRNLARLLDLLGRELNTFKEAGREEVAGQVADKILAQLKDEIGSPEFVA